MLWTRQKLFPKPLISASILFGKFSGKKKFKKPQCRFHSICRGNILETIWRLEREISVEELQLLLWKLAWVQKGTAETISGEYPVRYCLSAISGHLWITKHYQLSFQQFISITLNEQLTQSELNHLCQSSGGYANHQVVRQMVVGSFQGLCQVQVSMKLLEFLSPGWYNILKDENKYVMRMMYASELSHLYYIPIISWSLHSWSKIEVVSLINCRL